MNKEVESYFVDGCMRCPFGGTPDCKVHLWTEELLVLRGILLETGLTEESKWGVPCYTYQNNNIVVLAAFKNYCALGFFKGSLLSDSENILVQQTENTHEARQLRFTKVSEILPLENTIKAYIFEAIEIEKEGLKIPEKKVKEFPLPEELKEKFAQDPVLKNAFYELTPGRQKGYLLHFAGAKQSATRIARIEKLSPQIKQGKGLHDR